MISPPSRLSLIATILKKDLIEWSREMFWVVVSGAVLVVFGTLFWLLPDHVDESIYVGVYPTGLAEAFARAAAEEESEGVQVAWFESEEDLVSAIANGEEVEIDGQGRKVQIGIAFPERFLLSAVTDEVSTVRVYVDASVPEEIANAMSALIREMAYGVRILAMGGDPEAALPARFPDEETMVLGEDRAGDQIPFREKMRPMIAFMMLIMESLALAALIAVEIQTKTVTALLATPARTGDVLWAKSIAGTLLALSQVLIILAITNSFADSNVAALLLAALLGAVMATAVGMLTGAAGKDFMGTLFYGMLFLIPFGAPVFALLFPGSASWVVKVIPSWAVMQAMVGATMYDMKWADIAVLLGYALAWCVVLFAAGWYQLERRLQTL